MGNIVVQLTEDQLRAVLDVLEELVAVQRDPESGVLYEASQRIGKALDYHEWSQVNQPTEV